MADDRTIRDSRPRAGGEAAMTAAAAAAAARGLPVLRSFREILPTDPDTPGGRSIAFGELASDVQQMFQFNGLPAFVFDQASTGRRTLGHIARAGGRDILISEGTGYIKEGPPEDAPPATVTEVSWPQFTVTIPPNSSVHISINKSGIEVITSGHPNVNDVIVLGVVATDATSVVWLSQFSVDIVQPVPDLDNWIRRVVGPLVSTGLLVSSHGSPSLQLEVNAGEYYINKDFKTAPGAIPATFSYWYRDPLSPLGWTVVPGQTSIDPDNYDDGSGTLAPLAPGQWKKDLIFASPLNESSVEYHVFYGQETFVSQAAAESGNIPNALASLRTHAARLAGIVVTEGATDIASFVDVRPRLGQFAPPSTAITSHSDLTELSADDHPQYQLRSEENVANGYAGLDGSARISPLDGSQLTGITPGQVGADPAGSAAAAIGAHEATFDHANLPTTGQKAALVGTSGAPGGGNPYVTNADTTATPAASRVPRADGAGKVAAGWGGAANSLGTLDGSAQQPLTELKTMVGATGVSGGARGSVPTPVAGDDTKWLRGDASWVNPYPVAEVFLAGTGYNSNDDNYRYRSIGAAANYRFTFRAPFDFGSIVALELIGFADSAGGVGAGKDIDLASSYGAVGELKNNHTGSDTTSTYTIPAQNTLFAINIATLFASLAAGDFCGLLVTHNGVGGTIGYLGIRMRYNRA